MSGNGVLVRLGRCGVSDRCHKPDAFRVVGDNSGEIFPVRTRGESRVTTAFSARSAARNVVNFARMTRIMYWFCVSVSN